MAITTTIPAPDAPLIGPGGRIDPTWYLFLTQIFNRTGDGTGAVTNITALAPLATTGGTTPELSIRQATSGQSGAMSASDKSKLDSLSYSEGDWVPVLSFDTPGNLAVTYGTRQGKFTQIGRTIRLDFVIVTSAFTWSTASGALRITGLPLPANGGFSEFTGSLSWSGLTYTGAVIAPQILAANTSIIRLTSSGSGTARAQLNTSNTTSGTQVTLSGHIEYFV